MNNLFTRRKSTKTAPQLPKKAIDVLLGESVWAKDGDGRVAMTLSCRGDTDSLPKVKDAGKIKTVKGRKAQVMHNGLLVQAGGYHGDWMQKLITELKGHHEPQEEKVFYEILKRIPNKATMIELGAFWAYYSLWLHKEKPGSLNICCEPDSSNMKIGKTNATLNGFDDIAFVDAASGKIDGEIIELPMDSDPSVIERVKVRSVDSLVNEYGIEHLDLLHMDIQGYELEALQGALKIIAAGKLRFLIVSTHHYFFSKDPLTHQKCIDFITENGGHIIASHTVLESFSGDGLIAASFDKKDANMVVDVSINHTDDSLFRSYEKDLAMLMSAYDKLAG